MEISEILKNRRKELGLTLEYIAEYVGVGKGTVQKWETGQINNMKRDKIGLLSEVLKISPSILIYGDSFKKEPNSLSPACSMNCTENEKEMIRKYRCLSPEGRATVDAVINIQYKASRPQVKSDEEIS